MVMVMVMVMVTAMVVPMTGVRSGCGTREGPDIAIVVGPLVFPTTATATICVFFVFITVVALVLFPTIQDLHARMLIDGKCINIVLWYTPSCRAVRMFLLMDDTCEHDEFYWKKVGFVRQSCT